MREPALLVLADGAEFEGEAIGAFTDPEAEHMGLRRRSRRSMNYRGTIRRGAIASARENA